MSDENRCSLGPNVGHGGGARGKRKGRGRAMSGNMEYPQALFI